jgi:hypothetical protein
MIAGPLDERLLARGPEAGRHLLPFGAQRRADQIVKAL